MKNRNDTKPNKNLVRHRSLRIKQIIPIMAAAYSSIDIKQYLPNTCICVPKPPTLYIYKK